MKERQLACITWSILLEKPHNNSLLKLDHPSEKYKFILYNHDNMLLIIFYDEKINFKWFLADYTVREFIFWIKPKYIASFQSKIKIINNNHFCCCKISVISIRGPLKKRYFSVLIKKLHSSSIFVSYYQVLYNRILKNKRVDVFLLAEK